jgi:hypothetical protein
MRSAPDQREAVMAPHGGVVVFPSKKGFGFGLVSY